MKIKIMLIVGCVVLLAIVTMMFHIDHVRSFRSTDRFLGIGNKMISYLNTAPASNPVSLDAWVSLGVLSVEDRAYFLDRGITYKPPQERIMPETEILSYPFSSGARLVFLRSGKYFVKDP